MAEVGHNTTPYQSKASGPFCRLEFGWRMAAIASHTGKLGYAVISFSEKLASNCFGSRLLSFRQCP